MPPDDPKNAGKEAGELGEDKSAARLEIEKKILEIERDQSRNLHERHELTTKLISQNVEIERKKAKQLKDEAELHQIDIDRLEALGKIDDKQKERLADLKKQVAEYAKLALKAEKEADNLERGAAARKDQLAFTDNMIARLTGLKDKPTYGITRFIADPKGFSQALGASMGKVTSAISILTSGLDKVLEASIALAFEQDQSISNFRKATGASGEFDDNIIGLERSLYAAGVSAGEAGESVQSLFINVTDFTEMSEKQQEELGKTTAILNELGVSAQTSAKNIQFATKVLGLNTRQAGRLQRELFTFAQDLGVSASQIADDFAAMGPQIAALGSNGVDAFRKLEVQAKNTGLTLTEILGIVEKFDKFDSAAESVGKLNALLGGPYLNTLELVAETDPSKRFEIMKDRIDAAGLSFDDMDYYQRKALASAMGLNEQQLALMMRGKLELIREPQKSAEDLEKLALQTLEFNTLMDELKQTFMSFAVSMRPVMTGLKGILDTFQRATDWIPNEIKAVSVTIMGLLTFVGSLVLAFTSLGPAGTAAGSGLTAAAGGMATFAATALPFLLAFGVIAASIAAAFMVMPKILSEMNKFFGTTMVSSLNSTAKSVADIVDKINNLQGSNALLLTAMFAPMAAAAPALAVSSAAIDSVTRGAAPAGAAGAATGPDHFTFDLDLSIGGEEFSVAVNKVELKEMGPNNRLMKGVKKQISSPVVS
jgi:hypothetical protein